MGMYYEATGVIDWVYLNHDFSNPLDKKDKWVCKDLYSEQGFIFPKPDDDEHCILDGDVVAEIDENNIANFKATFIRPYGTDDTSG
jgi:hypothetical protein